MDIYQGQPWARRPWRTSLCLSADGWSFDQDRMVCDLFPIFVSKKIDYRNGPATVSRESPCKAAQRTLSEISIKLPPS